MNESIAHNPTCLPKHCVDAAGHLRKDLLRPASQAVQAMEATQAVQVGSPVSPEVARPALMGSRGSGFARSGEVMAEPVRTTALQPVAPSAPSGPSTPAGFVRTAGLTTPVRPMNTGNPVNAVAGAGKEEPKEGGVLKKAGAIRMGTFRRLWHLDSKT